MNLKLVSRLVGRVLLVEAFFMLLPLAVALLYQEDPAPFLLTILLMAILGLALSAVPATRHFYAREGLLCRGPDLAGHRRDGGAPLLLLRHLPLLCGLPV